MIRDQLLTAVVLVGAAVAAAVVAGALVGIFCRTVLLFT